MLTLSSNCPYVNTNCIESEVVVVKDGSSLKIKKYILICTS